MKKATTFTLPVAVFNLLAAIFYITQLPSKVPTHFNAKWICDSTGSKWTGLILPILVLVMPLIYPIAAKFTKERNKKPFAVIFTFITVFFVFMGWMALLTMGSEVALGEKLESRIIEAFVPVAVACMFIAFGNYMPVIEHNKTLGIKIKWTLENENCWKITHRFAGKLWVITGIIMLLISVILAMTKTSMAIWGIVLELCIISINIIVPTIVAYKHRND